MRYGDVASHEVQEPANTHRVAFSLDACVVDSLQTTAGSLALRPAEECRNLIEADVSAPAPMTVCVDDLRALSPGNGLTLAFHGPQARAPRATLR